MQVALKSDSVTFCYRPDMVVLGGVLGFWGLLRAIRMNTFAAAARLDLVHI